MLGAPLDGSVLLLGDNKSVVFKLNTTIPSSVAIAAHIVCCCHVDTQVNLADVLNKHSSNDDFHCLVKPILFRNPGEPRLPLKA